MNKTLYLIRGWSGAGKTTLASMLAKAIDSDRVMMSAVKCLEADMFFNRNGEYVFDFEKLADAHRWCQEQAEDKMRLGKPNVIVSNTFIRNWEMEPYFRLAAKHGYQLQILECKGRFQNVHGVPDEKVAQQRANFEELDYNLIQEIMDGK